MKTLKNCISLNHKVKIYVPSTVNVEEKIDNDWFSKDCLQFLGKVFNGATSYHAFGSWLTAKGDLVYERITICESFCNEESLSSNIEKIYDYCRTLKVNMSQEAIALEIDNVMYFI